MKKVKVYTDYGGMIGPGGVVCDNPPSAFVSVCDYLDSQARIAALEAAVRWAASREPSWFATWKIAHPIVSEVVEKGGE